MKHIFCFLFTGWIFISSYAQMKAVETSHYLLPEFRQGTVLLKDGRINKALLNYNSLTEEMIFEKNDMKLAIAKHLLKDIDTINIEERKFVVLNNKIVEIVYQSGWNLFVEHRCKVKAEGASTGFGEAMESSSARSFSTLQTQAGAAYDLDLPGYNTKPYIFYWLRKNDRIFHFRNLKELKKHYADKRDVIKKYSKSNRIMYEDQQSIIQFIEFLESKRNSAS